MAKTNRSDYGFVYILANEAMPGLYKIGCTERSPHARATELSAASGVPRQFSVLCYAEFASHHGVEQSLHAHLAASRLNARREFFGDLREAVAFLYWHPDRLGFSHCLPDIKFWRLIHDAEEDGSLPGTTLPHELPSPWKPLHREVYRIALERGHRVAELELRIERGERASQ